MSRRGTWIAAEMEKIVRATAILQDKYNCK